MKLPSLTTVLAAASTFQSATAAAIPNGMKSYPAPGALTNSTLPTNGTSGPAPRAPAPKCSGSAIAIQALEGVGVGFPAGGIVGAVLGFASNIVVGDEDSLSGRTAGAAVVGAIAGAIAGGAGWPIYNQHNGAKCAEPDPEPIAESGNATAAPTPAPTSISTSTSTSSLPPPFATTAGKLGTA